MRERLMGLEEGSRMTHVAIIGSGRFGSMTVGPDNAAPQIRRGRLLRRQPAVVERRKGFED